MLSEVSGDLLYLRAAVDMGDSNEVTLNVKSNGDRDLTAFIYNAQEGTIRQAIIGWAKVPPDFPCFEMIPVAFVWSIHNLGVRVKDAAFFLASSSL